MHPLCIHRELMCYDDTTEPLFLTDLDRLHGRPQPSSVSGEASEECCSSYSAYNYVAIVSLLTY